MMEVEEGERAVGKWETRRVRKLGRLEEVGKKRVGREEREGWRAREWKRRWRQSWQGAREVGEEGEVKEMLQREKEE